MLPGHATHPDLVTEDGIIRDEAKNLSVGSIVQMEIEANQFAADCIFQLDQFTALVRTKQLDWDNIKQAAKENRVECFVNTGSSSFAGNAR